MQLHSGKPLEELLKPSLKTNIPSQSPVEPGGLILGLDLNQMLNFTKVFTEVST